MTFIRIGAKFKTYPQNVTRRATDSGEKALKRAAALVYKIARNSIKRRKNHRTHSSRGTAPFTHTGRLKKGIRFGLSNDKRSAVVGPTMSELGRIGQTHEFGGREVRKQTVGDYPARPFMEPALKAAMTYQDFLKAFEVKAAEV